MTNSAASAHESARGMTRGVYVAAAITIVVFLATIALVIDHAGRIADRFALDTERSKVQLEMQRQVDEAARQQAEISNWDETIEKVVEPAKPDPGFTSDEIAEWLTDDLGFSWAVIVDAANTAKVVAADGEALAGVTGLPLVQSNLDMIETARDRYVANRVRTETGFMVPVAPGAITPQIQVTQFRMVDGVAGIVTAQVVVPESVEYSLAENQTHVLLTVKPLTAQVVAAMGTRLNLFEPRISYGKETGERRPSTGQIKLATPDGVSDIVLKWRPRAPWPVIISRIMPFAGGLCLIFCAMIGYIVFRHARTLKALAASEAQNRFLASHDTLTRLANRSHFDQQLDAAIERLKESRFAVLCIDLDKFKAVNDTHGHHAGDEVLRQIATRFRSRVGEKGLVARVGGDEFIALIHAVESREDVLWLAENLIEDACQPVVYGTEVLRVGASVGVAIAPQAGNTARTLINAADTALYRSKNEGRGRASMVDGAEESRIETHVLSATG